MTLSRRGWINIYRLGRLWEISESSVDVMSRLDNYSQRRDIFLVSKAARAVLEPIQLPIPWVPAALVQGYRGWCVRFIISSRSEIKSSWSCNSTPTYVLKTGTRKGLIWSVDKHKTEAFLEEEDGEQEDSYCNHHDDDNAKHDFCLGSTFDVGEKQKEFHCILFTNKIKGNDIYLRTFKLYIYLHNISSDV